LFERLRMRTHDVFETPIEYLKGVGPLKADLLKKELGVFTFGDLLHYFPFRYVDRTKFYKVKEVRADLPYIQVRGVLKSLAERGDKRRKFLTGKIQDETGTLELVWFKGVKWITNMLKVNSEYIVFGKPTEYKGFINIAHPEMELASEAATTISSSMQAVYSSTEKLKAKGLDSRGIHRLQKTLQPLLPPVSETLPQYLRDEMKLMNRNEAIINVHFPETLEKEQKAAFRLKFEEFFLLQMKMLVSKIIRTEETPGLPFEKVGEFFNRFYNEKLPFPLTEAQKRVLREIRQDCGSGKQMNRLLQGDVGSGKTIVALMSMLIAIDNGYQACIMAPTEILAGQHAETIGNLLSGMNVNVALLTGSTKGKQRKHLFEELQNGNIHILIGTHALIEDNVLFNNLGLVVIDEQHRFGVEQRAKLQTKISSPNGTPHVLVMTATPIPRTLAMTLYGDLDVSVIDEMPPGRKEIQTYHRKDSNRLAVWGFLKKQIEEGRQVYIVYPLIEESEKMDLKNLMEGFESISLDFPMPKYHVSIVHGKMKSADKDFEMQRFIKRDTNILIATTVIEVGVNVPNASVMIIESAERFGLSQLHQLRGRVGRGSAQSYCILMTADNLGRDAYTRMKTMCETNDGFKIAEIDMELRGAGDIEGTQQSGAIEFKIANIASDGKILQTARDTALRILREDPHLSNSQNELLRRRLSEMLKEGFVWGRVA
jgi:ATP-dependent DNA helicase RecG